MTDPDLVAKRLALVETCVEQLRTLARPEALRTDVREERFVEHTLQVAIQAALPAGAVNGDQIAARRLLRARVGLAV